MFPLPWPSGASTQENPLPDDLHPFVSRLLGRRPAEPESDRPKAARRIKELEQALAREQTRSTLMQRRCELAEERARELARLAAWGGRR